MKINLNKILRRIIHLIVLSGVIFSLSSCGKVIYTSATYGSIKSYTPKQEYREKDTSAIYVSGTLSIGAHEPVGNIKDKKTIISTQFHKSVTRKYFNLHYGVGASQGTYKFGSSFENTISKNEKKQFYSVDAKIGINFNLPTHNIDWRILGLEIGYNYEFGPFQDKLKKIKDNTSALVINKESIFSYNFNSEVIFKLSNSNAIGIGLFVEDIFDRSKESIIDNSGYIGAFMSYKYRRFTFSYVVEDSWSLNDNVSTHKFGLSFQLF